MTKLPLMGDLAKGEDKRVSEPARDVVWGLLKGMIQDRNIVTLGEVCEDGIALEVSVRLTFSFNTQVRS
jgi:hypothetical protein